MFAYVTNDGETLAAFDASENESCDHWAAHYCDMIGQSVDADCLNQPSSYLPAGGDFTVTVATQHDFHNGGSCWSERNYFFAR